MFVSSVLPDVMAMLPNVQFTQRLELHVDVPADGTDKPVVTVSADGRQIELPPVAGEVSLPGLA